MIYRCRRSSVSELSYRKVENGGPTTTISTIGELTRTIHHKKHAENPVKSHVLTVRTAAPWQVRAFPDGLVQPSASGTDQSVASFSLFSPHLHCFSDHVCVMLSRSQSVYISVVISSLESAIDDYTCGSVSDSLGSMLRNTSAYVSYNASLSNSADNL